MSHMLKITLEPGALSSSLICDEPAGASCRSWCEWGCDGPSEEHDMHPLVDQGGCAYVEWWNFDTASALEEGYDGPKLDQLVGGLVRVISCNEDEGIRWDYIETPVRQNGSES